MVWVEFVAHMIVTTLKEYGWSYYIYPPPPPEGPGEGGWVSGINGGRAIL